MSATLGDHFVHAEEARVDSLEKLKTYLTEAEQRDVKRDEFSDLFALSLRVLELDHEAAARLFKTSRPTVSRWAAGQSAPHMLGRSAVFRALRKVASDRIRQHPVAMG
ncbi:hypothetical protein [Mycolicibacterium goodii]|uniref:Helix-turn-helix domain-containing protein n=1 Tax=Mycolicibacterium goodii TaxID=134601 RepID=A0ABS6HT54_MYCGD|nr:hypothetical protein [Mycolicibacterium goodii]MBU8825816.1 hypothetical protein [Mycolicibacterium goodii]MBU8840798.1 hypothetical protein [Mycolicibacterium goodii]